MHELIWFATLVVLVGGIMEGSFALPMRFARHWAWENIWMAYSLIGLIVIPWIAASVSVPALADAYRAVPLRTLGTTALFGLGWGIANVLFGLAVPIVGIALSIAIIVGMSAALGSLIPLVLSDPWPPAQADGVDDHCGSRIDDFGSHSSWSSRQSQRKSPSRHRSVDESFSEVHDLWPGPLYTGWSAGSDAELQLCLWVANHQTGSCARCKTR